MFTVYKITNLINNKCYIGSSIRVEKRWKEHKNAANNINNPNYNYPLYQAFRKYGIDNFLFSIIADNFDSIEEMENYEHEMIIFYNSLCPNGYNQTLETHSNNIALENIQKHIKEISCKCAKIDFNENIIEIYTSYHDAARKNNRDAEYEASKIRSVCKGDRVSCFNGMIFRDLDENNKIISKPTKNSHGKKSIVGININNPEKEIYFESISEASRVLNIDRKSIGLCLQGNSRYSYVGGYIWREIDLNGNIIEISPTIEEKIFEYNETNPLINGERHTITEWCEIFDITRTTYYKRRKKGMDIIAALTTPKRR